MSKKLLLGWGKPLVSRKWHFFPAGETFSLCGRVGFYFGERDNHDHDHKENCAECKRRRTKREDVMS